MIGLKNSCFSTNSLAKLLSDIHLINQARGPYWENIGPRSWQYGPSAARSLQKRPRADILPVRSRASLVNKSFITRLKKAKTQVRDYLGQCPVRYLENIGPAIEHFDWLILVIGPLTALSRVIKFVIGHFVIRQFVIGQFNRPITFEVVV